MSKTKKEKEILLKRSYNHFVNSDREECLALLKEAVQLDPYCHKTYYLLSLLYEETDQELPFLLLACYLKKNDINLWVRAYELTKDPLIKIKILNQIYKITDSKTKREILYELLKLYSLLNDTPNIYKIQIKLLKFTGNKLNSLINELLINVYKGRNSLQKSVCLNLVKEIFNYKLSINLENYLNLVYVLFKCNLFKIIRKIKKFCGYKIRNTLYNDIILLTKKVNKKDFTYFSSDFTDLMFFYVDFLIHNDLLEEAMRILNSMKDKKEIFLNFRFFYKEKIFKVKILNDLLVHCRNKALGFDFFIKLRIGCIFYEKKNAISLEIFSQLYSLDPYNKYFRKILGRENFFTTLDVHSLMKKFIRNSKKGGMLLDKYSCNNLFLESKDNKILENKQFLEIKKNDTSSGLKKKKLWGVLGNDWFVFLYNFILDCQDTKLIIQILNSNNISVLKKEQTIFLALISLRKSFFLNDFNLFLESCKRLTVNYHLIYFLLSVKNFNFLDKRFYNTQRSVQRILKTKLFNKENELICDELNELSTSYLSTFLPHYIFRDTLNHILVHFKSNPLLIPIILTTSTSRRIFDKKELINRVIKLVKDDYNLGRVYQFIGLNGKAEEYYKKVNNKFSYFNLALIYKKSCNTLMYKKMIKEINKD